MARINIKPLSVNKAYRGRRFKSADYKNYTEELMLCLDPVELPEGPLEAFYTWGVSNLRFDVDNACKPFQDVLCDFLGIDDSRIYKITMEKVKMPIVTGKRL